jgi:hypothetical protein
LLLAFASTVIPGFSLLEINYQEVYFLLDMYMFRNRASSSTKVGSVFLWKSRETERERERQWGEVVRDTTLGGGGGPETISLVLKVPRKCPLVLV